MNNDDLPRKGEDKEIQPREANGVSLEEVFFSRLPFICILLVFILLIIVPIARNFISFGPKCGSYCGCAEQDAKNVLASLASYFSEPENMRIPTVKVLISEADLSLNNPVANIIIFPRPGVSAQSQSISVMVIDDSERCPRNSSYVSTMGGGIGYWK